LASRTQRVRPRLSIDAGIGRVSIVSGIEVCAPRAGMAPRVGCVTSARQCCRQAHVAHAIMTASRRSPRMPRV